MYWLKKIQYLILQGAETLLPSSKFVHIDWKNTEGFLFFTALSITVIQWFSAQLCNTKIDFLTQWKQKLHGNTTNETQVKTISLFETWVN